MGQESSVSLFSSCRDFSKRGPVRFAQWPAVIRTPRTFTTIKHFRTYLGQLWKMKPEVFVVKQIVSTAYRHAPGQEDLPAVASVLLFWCCRSFSSARFRHLLVDLYSEVVKDWFSLDREAQVQRWDIMYAVLSDFFRAGRDDSQCGHCDPAESRVRVTITTSSITEDAQLAFRVFDYYCPVLSRNG